MTAEEMPRPVPPDFVSRSALHIDPDDVDGDEAALDSRAQRIRADVRELAEEAVRVRDQHARMIDALKAENAILRADLQHIEERHLDEIGKLGGLMVGHSRKYDRDIALLMSALKQIDTLNRGAGEYLIDQKIAAVLEVAFKEFGVER